MSRWALQSERRQSPREEIANAVSHAVGLVAAIAAAPFLIASTAWRQSTATVVGASIFVATMVMLYFSSTLYHALPRGRAKRFFRVVDHGAIYLLIAGTYTPFTLGVLRGEWGWMLFVIVWMLAIVGIASKAVVGFRYPASTTGLYLSMGWLALVAVEPLWERVPLPGLLWVAAGGLAYTVGVAFFRADRLRYAHFVWHLFVIVGTACHFVAVLNYAA